MGLAWRVRRGFTSWLLVPWRHDPPLWLQVLGPLTLSGFPLRGHRRKAFFVLLLEARVSGREGLGVLELLDGLYPGQEEAKAFGALRELVFTVRRQFGPRVIERKGPLYVLGKGIVSDLEAFLHTPQPWLWRGRYLDGLATDLSLWARVLDRAIKLVARLSGEAPQEAFRLAHLLLQEEPYSEETLVVALESLQALGQPGLGWRVYQEARVRFQEVGVDLPEAPGDFLSTRLSKGMGLLGGTQPQS